MSTTAYTVSNVLDIRIFLQIITFMCGNKIVNPLVNIIQPPHRSHLDEFIEISQNNNLYSINPPSKKPFTALWQFWLLGFFTLASVGTILSCNYDVSLSKSFNCSLSWNTILIRLYTVLTCLYIEDRIMIVCLWRCRLKTNFLLSLSMLLLSVLINLTIQMEQSELCGNQQFGM